MVILSGLSSSVTAKVLEGCENQIKAMLPLQNCAHGDISLSHTPQLPQGSDTLLALYQALYQ